jgi:histidinol-phosphate aminotransferase
MPLRPSCACQWSDCVSSAFERFVRPHLLQMEPYVPILPFEVLSRQLGRTPGQIVKLDANENPYGPPSAVHEALFSYPFLHIYPDPEQHELREALSAYTGVPAKCLLPGHGADELLDLICRVFLDPGDLIIDCPPTFGMYGFDAQLARARIAAIPRHEDFSVDVEAIENLINGEAARAGRVGRTRVDCKLVFVTSPNNPDGGLIRPEELARLLKLPVMVVLDEAYIEFAGLDRSLISWVSQYENLIVLRTFSKWAGMAGLRLGYGAFPEWLMPALLKAKQPYNVNVAATVAGLVALSCRRELQLTVDRLVRERDRLVLELGAFSFLRPHPSHANFVLCKVVDRDAAVLKANLAQQGVLVRHYARPRLENYIRVSAGRPSDTESLLAALRVVE